MEWRKSMKPEYDLSRLKARPNPYALKFKKAVTVRPSDEASDLMSSTYYNPESAPNPAAWLAHPEGERIRLVKIFHVSERIELPDVEAHSAAHVIVENQVASGYGPSCRALARLQEQGLSRHEALHAIAMVVCRCLQSAVVGSSPPSTREIQLRMSDEIDALSAAEWRSIG
jgi:hypothetical protein